MVGVVSLGGDTVGVLARRGAASVVSRSKRSAHRHFGRFDDR